MTLHKSPEYIVCFNYLDVGNLPTFVYFTFPSPFLWGKYEVTWLVPVAVRVVGTPQTLENLVCLFLWDFLVK